MPDLRSFVNKSTGSHSCNDTLISDVIDNGFISVDRRWDVCSWNKAAERIMGVSAKEIVGSNLWQRFANILPLDFYMVYNKAFLQDNPFHFHEYWPEMGAWFDVVTWHDKDILSISFKTSQRRFQDEHRSLQLQTFNELYRLISEVTNDCLWEWNLISGEIFWIDGGHKRVMGYDIVNATIPKEFWEAQLHPEDKAGVLERLRKLLAEGVETIWEDEYRFKKVDGEYVYVHDRGHVVYEEEMPVRIIGATQDISRKVYLENKLVHERHENQKELIAAVLTAQEKEREEIGMELHDNLNQILAITKLYIRMARQDSEKSDMYLDKSSELITNVIDELRRMSKKLVIPGIEIIGLDDNIRNLLYDTMKIDPIRIGFNQNCPDSHNFPAKLQLTLFRIVQEQVTNILRHAAASFATVDIDYKDKQVILTISDNGKGCDLSINKEGVGLINIKSRAGLYEGHIEVLTKPGEGFILKVYLMVDLIASPSFKVV